MSRYAVNSLLYRLKKEPEFRDMLARYATDAEFMQAIEGVPVTIDQWQLEKLALASRSAVGNEKPRSITPLTTLNIVVTPQMPRASTMTARAQKDRSLMRMRRPMRMSRRNVSGTDL